MKKTQQLAKLEGHNKRWIRDKRQQLNKRWGLLADRKWHYDKRWWLNKR
jgi:hypothetical protein